MGVQRTPPHTDSFFHSHPKVACGNRDIRNIVSACTVWFTFVFRTPIPRAVEDFIVEVLHDSRGSTLALRLPRIPHLYLDYITHLVICQALFLIFLEVMVGLVPPSQELGRNRTALPPFPSRPPCLSLLPLCPYYIIRMGFCQGVFKSFLKLFFNQHHSLSCCAPLWTPL